MNRTQQGRVGELALALYGMVSSDGELELFTPVSDEDHVDVTAGRRGGVPAIGIQVKTALELDKDGLAEATARYPEGHVREHPAYLYAVLHMTSVAIETAWILPSPDFNRLVYRIKEAGAEVLEFRAHPAGGDAFAGFRVPGMKIGPHLISVIDSLEEKIPPDFLAATS